MNDGTVTVSDVATAKDLPTGGMQLEAQMTPKASEDEVCSVLFSRDSNWVSVGTKDARVQVYAAANGKQLFNENNNSQVSGICFTPDGLFSQSEFSSATFTNTFRHLPVSSRSIICW